MGQGRTSRRSSAQLLGAVGGCRGGSAARDRQYGQL